MSLRVDRINSEPRVGRPPTRNKHSRIKSVSEKALGERDLSPKPPSLSTKKIKGQQGSIVKYPCREPIYVGINEGYAVTKWPRTHNLRYNGEWKNGHYHGQGIICDFGGKMIYSGGFFEGDYHGWGRKLNKKTGIWEDCFHYLGLRYEGRFCNGKPHGKGILYESSDVKKYEGQFKNGQFNEGKEFDIDGNIINEGIWEKGVLTKPRNSDDVG